MMSYMEDLIAENDVTSQVNCKGRLESRKCSPEYREISPRNKVITYGPM